MVIGSLLIFTILILAFSGYQAFAVPDQNAQVEAEHFQTVEDQFSRLQGDAVNAVDSTDVRSTSITLGTRYPSRAFALNPPPAAGRLETTAAGDVEFATGESVCRAGGATATTRSLVYTPGYGEFAEPRAVGYESRVLSREFEGGTRYDQRLVRSTGGADEISLFLLTGAVSENGVDSYSLELNGSNRHTTTLTNPQVTLPSRFEAATWENEILGGRSDVTATDVGDRVELSFDGGDYRVSCAVVGLDGTPAFTPPSDGGSTGSDAAYDTEWLDPSGEPGTTSCSDTRCTLNASISKKLDLTAGTSPTAQDATVRFSVSDRSVGTVSPATSETGSGGDASTRLRARSNGTVKVYAASGGSGDVIDVTVTDFPPLRTTAVFADNQKKITTAERSAGTTTLAPKARVLGPLIADIDSNGTEDIPYIPNGGSKIHIVDQDGSVTELSSNDAKKSKSLLGVGRWDGARTSVYFASGDESTIYRTNPSEGDVRVAEPNNQVSAVAGPGDVDGDDTKELVYADGSQALRYFEPGAGPGSATGTKIPLTNGLGSNNGIGLGRPADFDGDGTSRIPVADSSNRLVLVDSNGNEEVLVRANVNKVPVAAVDWDEDGELEVMFLDGKDLKYVDDVAGGQTVKDTGISKVNEKTGVT